MNKKLLILLFVAAMGMQCAYGMNQDKTKKTDKKFTVFLGNNKKWMCLDPKYVKIIRQLMLEKNLEKKEEEFFFATMQKQK